MTTDTDILIGKNVGKTNGWIEKTAILGRVVAIHNDELGEDATGNWAQLRRKGKTWRRSFPLAAFSKRVSQIPCPSVIRGPNLFYFLLSPTYAISEGASSGGRATRKGLALTVPNMGSDRRSSVALAQR